MKIMHLVNHCNHGHGNVHVAVDLACSQAERGDQVIYVSAGGNYMDLLSRYGVRHEAITQNSRNPFRLAWSVIRLFVLCFRFRPDILHAHMMAGAVFGYIASLVTRVPLVTTVHNSFDSHSKLMRLGDRIVAVSQSEKTSLVEKGFPSACVKVVINGANHSPRDKFDLSHSNWSPSMQRPCAVTVCGLHRRKGVHDLIHAFHEIADRFPDWRLYIAGNGPDRVMLTDIAANTEHSDRIIFLGSIANSIPILAQTDIFVLASYADPCCLAITEAREAGCALIATKVGGSPELLEFGEAGQLVDPGSPGQIAAKLEFLMKDTDTLALWRQKSLNNSEYFRVSRVVKDYDTIYEEVLSVMSRR